MPKQRRKNAAVAVLKVRLSLYSCGHDLKLQGHRMKALILAGDSGPRISDENYLKLKAMIELAAKPLHWNILKLYSAHGVNEFVICRGY